MSYSFGVKAATKAAALALVKENMTEVLQHQPEHVADEPLVNAAAEAAVALLQDDDTREVGVGVYGSLSWEKGDTTQDKVSSISCVTLNLTAGLQKRT